MGFKTDLETVVLGTLQGKSMHGYEISKRIAAKSEGLLRIGEGQLYPTLHKLEQQGLVTAEWIPQEGKPSRKVYSLTESGLAKLAEKRKGWEQFSQSIGAIIAHPKEALDG
ncbi:MAG: PadR family transcriptional regulator [Fimbriimonadales bacterium]